MGGEVDEGRGEGGWKREQTSDGDSQLMMREAGKEW
jgi:hypothetical protein